MTQEQFDELLAYVIARQNDIETAQTAKTKLASDATVDLGFTVSPYLLTKALAEARITWKGKPNKRRVLKMEHIQTLAREIHKINSRDGINSSPQLVELMSLSTEST